MEINIDNQRAIRLAENPTSSDRSKHIDLKVFHVRLSMYRIMPTEVLVFSKMQQHSSNLGIADPGGLSDVVQTVTETVLF